MDNYVYNAFDKYFNALSKTGYIKYDNVLKLKTLGFYYSLIYHDYRGYISKEDYEEIEKALNCLYGTNCLMPYPDYLKMGKLKLGEITELAQRTKSLEEYDKVLDQRIKDNDVLIKDNIRRIDEYGTRLDDHDATLVNHGNRITTIEGRIDDPETGLVGHERRILAIENKPVVKGKDTIQTIDDIDLSVFDNIDD